METVTQYYLCLECGKPIISGQMVYMDVLDGLHHAKCFCWDHYWIHDMGEYKEIVDKYPHIF